MDLDRLDRWHGVARQLGLAAAVIVSLGLAGVAAAQEDAPTATPERPVPAAEATPPPDLPELTFPFSEGETWRITCGYADDSGCQHKDNDWNRYALDFQNTGGPAATKGLPVLASADGVVEIAEWGGEDSFGWYVQIAHGAGYKTIYAHLQSKPDIATGAEVERGDHLGETGCTGRCTGPHIHFVLMHNGESIPPEPMCGEQGLDDGQVHTGCTAAKPPPPSGAGTAGDATCDGAANSVDAAVVLQHDAGLVPELGCPGAADVNWDDSVDSLDASLILQFGAGLIPSLWHGVWTAGAAMPTPRTEVTSAEVEGVIYVIGGFTANGQNSMVAEAYDTIEDTWTPIAPYPHPIDHAVAASAYGKVYVFGGYTNFGGRVVSPSVHEFDPATGQWTARADLPLPRAADAAVEVDGIIYIFGGVGTSPTVPMAYDPVSNTFSTLEPMREEREHLSAAAVDGLIYVIAGRQETFTNVGIAEVYNTATDSWASIDPLPTARGGLTAAALAGQVHVLGGEDLAPDGTTFAEHEVYNPVTGIWKPAAPLPTPRHGLTSQVVNGKLYVIGGGPTPSLSVSDVVDIFSLPYGSE